MRVQCVMMGKVWWGSKAAVTLHPKSGGREIAAAASLLSPFYSASDLSLCDSTDQNKHGSSHLS